MMATATRGDERASGRDIGITFDELRFNFFISHQYTSRVRQWLFRHASPEFSMVVQSLATHH
jgi:hypothetical protein